jgi:hypothetical protein
MIRAYGQNIATVSAISADEITRYFRIPCRRIDIISGILGNVYCAPLWNLHEKLCLEAGGYFLVVSSLASNKLFFGRALLRPAL